MLFKETNASFRRVAMREDEKINNSKYRKRKKRKNWTQSHIGEVRGKIYALMITVVKELEVNPN